MKRFAIIAATALLGACANGQLEPLDPIVLARASCIHQIPVPKGFDFEKFDPNTDTEKLVAVYNAVRQCLEIK